MGSKFGTDFYYLNNFFTVVWCLNPFRQVNGFSLVLPNIVLHREKKLAKTC